MKRICHIPRKSYVAAVLFLLISTNARLLYNMSIKLTTLSLNIINLPSTEKFILTALCFRANQNNEAYSCIERLENDTSLKKRTIEPALKSLRNKNILIYTGRYEGKKHNIPVYRINLDTGKFCRDKDLTTAIFAFNTGNFCIDMTAKIAVQKDYIKNNKKDNAKSFACAISKTQGQGQEQKQKSFWVKYSEYLNGMKITRTHKFNPCPHSLLSYEDWIAAGMPEYEDCCNA